MTVAENIAVTPSLLRWSATQISERIDELLKLVDLDSSYRGRFPAQLSGGEQQRVGVARALAARPKFVLFDEPFGALDPLTRDRLQDAFRQLRADLGLTGLFVTHDMAEALLLSDRIAVIRAGRIVQIGTPEELARRPANEYVEGLLETPRRQARIYDRLSRGAVHA
jgi:osmoprotectant transport system ATP-binding protein